MQRCKKHSNSTYLDNMLTKYKYLNYKVLNDDALLKTYALDRQAVHRLLTA